MFGKKFKVFTLLGFLSIKLDLEKENRFSEKSKQVNVPQKELTVPSI